MSINVSEYLHNIRNLEYFSYCSSEQMKYLAALNLKKLKIPSTYDAPEHLIRAVLDSFPNLRVFKAGCRVQSSFTEASAKCPYLAVFVVPFENVGISIF